MKKCNKCGAVYYDKTIVCAPLLHACDGELVKANSPALLPEEKQTGKLRYPLSDGFKHLPTRIITEGEA